MNKDHIKSIGLRGLEATGKKIISQLKLVISYLNRSNLWAWWLSSTIIESDKLILRERVLIKLIKSRLFVESVK